MKTLIQTVENFLQEKQHFQKLYTELVKQKDNSKNDIKFELKEKFDKFELELRNYLMKTNQLLAKICQLYSSKGLEFSNNRFYIKNNLPPNPVNFDHNNAFQVAKLCIDTVNNCIKAALSRELTVDEIKKIWICHHSLNCIMISKKSLFEAASRPVQEEESQEFKKLEKEFKLVAKKKEDLENEVGKLVNKYKNSKDKKTNESYKNKIYLGTGELDCPYYVTEYLLSKYDYNILENNQSPIILGLGENEKNVAFFENVENFHSFELFLESVYYNNALNFDSALKVGKITIPNAKNASSKLINSLKTKNYDDKDKEYSLFDMIIGSSEKEDEIETLLSLKEGDFEHIEEFNSCNELSKKDYTLILVDNFPGCLNTDDKIRNFIKLVDNSKKYGMFFIINGKYKKQDYQKEYSENENSTNLSLSFAVENGNINIYNFSNKSYKFITINDKESVKQKYTIFKLNKKRSTFLLKDKEKFVSDKLFDPNYNYVSNNIGSGISIPIGFTDKGELYNFTTNTSNNPFAAITGIPGSGKTAFIHTLILMGGLKYSPEELQFYIVDFKDAKGSADFEAYKYNEKLRNLYIPHIKYLSVKSTQENAFDVLNMINKCAGDNLEKIRKAGFQNFGDYNRSEKVMKGELKKIPQIYFIIDEYGTMLSGGSEGNANHSDKSQIKKKLSSILKRIRSSGVGIIFSGQRASDMDYDNFSFLRTHIAYDIGKDYEAVREALNIPMGTKSISELRRLFNFNYLKQGYAVFKSVNNVDCVHVIYTGDVNSELQLKYADLIRKRCQNKYSNKQILPGFDALERADSFLNETVSEKEGRKIIVSDEDSEGNIVFDYEAGLKMSLYLGVTNSTSIPMAMKFFNETENHIIYASTEKITKVATDAMLAILYETRGKEYKYKKNINYLALPMGNDTKARQQAVKELKEYQKQYKIIDRRINIVENAKESLECLLEMYELYDKRKMSNITFEEVDLDTPYYVIINKIDWMFDESIINRINLVKDNVKEEVIEEDEEDDDFDDFDLSGIEGLSGDNLNALKGTSAKPKPSRTFKYSDVVKAINALLKEGATYNIYLIVGTSQKQICDKLVKGCGFGNMLEYPSLTVGSYNVLQTLQTKGGHESANIAYLFGENSAIRLYDYSSEAAKSWWQKVEK